MKRACIYKNAYLHENHNMRVQSDHKKSNYFRMKNVLMIVLLFGLFACTQAPIYKVKVKLASAQGNAYLSQRIKGDWVKLDSAVIKNGECQFKGYVKNPDIYYLSVSKRQEKLLFFIENSVISIVGVVDSLTSAKVSGSFVHDEYQVIQNKMDELDKKGMVLYEQSKEAEKAGVKVKADSLMTLADNIFNSIDDLQKDFVKTHPTSWVSPYLLSRVQYDMEADVLKNYLSAFDAKLDSLPIVVALKDRVAKMETVAVGKFAPDFTMNDVTGTPQKLSDVYSKNQYTLIDFWASWCGPCRHENPNVVAVFKSFKSKGFGVIGISLDTKKDKWEKAIADDQLTWPHVSDLKGWKNEVAALYSINSIPSNLLVDKSGKIIGRNLREGKLRETIAGLLK